jgi:hypothetical protein
METIMSFRTLLFCSVTLALAAACQDDRTAALDKAAEEVSDEREDLAEAQKELAATQGQDLEERADVAHASADMATAEVDFDRRRDAMVTDLRFRHHVYQTQAAVARGILADPSMTEDDRQRATDLLLTFERELGESEQAIDALATATAAQWEAANVTVANAFQQLEGAHDDAFDVLGADRKIVR